MPQAVHPPSPPGTDPRICDLIEAALRRVGRTDDRVRGQKLRVFLTAAAYVVTRPRGGSASGRAATPGRAVETNFAAPTGRV